MMAEIYSDSWKISGVRGVVFDKDGTLIDSHIYWGEIIRRRASALAEELGAGPEMRERLAAAMGYDHASGRLRPEGPIALKSRAEVIKAVVQCAASGGLSLSPEKAASVFSSVQAELSGNMQGFIRPLPGVKTLLAALSAASVPCSLVTSDSAASSMEILGIMGLGGAFSAVLGRESCREPKESGLPAIEAARAMVAPPSAVICVGDAPVDVQMAEKAGLLGAVAVATGQVCPEDLKKLTPYFAGSLNEIKVGKDA